MSQLTQNYQDKIKNNNQLLLNHYKNLIECHENSRQLYEKLIAEYEANNRLSTTVIKCSQVSVENDSWTVTKFGLQTVTNSVVIYTSGNYSKWKTWTLDLTGLDLAPNSQYYVKALVEGPDSLSNVIIEYSPTANATAFFKLTGGVRGTSLTYIALL